jgi:hypothetical protein
MLDGLLVFVSCQQWHDRWGDGYTRVQAVDVYEVLYTKSKYNLLRNIKHMLHATICFA